MATIAEPAHAADAPVPLGTAATYGVLSGASVGNTAGVGTIVRGDLGVSSAGAITGFGPGDGVVTGTIHSNDSHAIQAQADVVAAYNNAAARPQTFPLAGDLIGLTLTPGVHHSAAAVANTGIVTLNGQGDTNAVFIFQIGAAFSMAAATQVKLTNGTRAANVFWQVNGAAAVGAGSSFAGTIMAMDAISIGAGTLVNGRLLARTGAIALNNNSFYTNPPVVTIAGGPAVSTSDSTPTITGTAPGMGGTPVTVTIAGQTLTAPVQGDGSWTVTAALLANSTYHPVASVTDPAGNTGTATQALTVDTVLPTMTITGGATASTNDTTPTIAGTTDVGVDVTVTVTVAGQTLTALVQPAGTWNVTLLDPLLGGTHTVVASVADLAGNPGTATQALTVDTAAPVVTITGGATASTMVATPSITGTAPDVATGTTVTVTIDDQTLTAPTLSDGSWTVTAAPLTNGTYTVVASVTDLAGNPGIATQELTVDTELPVVTITGGAATSTNDTTPTIMGTTDAAAGAVVTVTVAGQTLTTLVQTGGTWNVTPAMLVNGTHAVVVSVTDPAGNPGSATQALTVDTAAPTVTIAGGPARSTNDATPTITGTTGEPAGATVTVTVAGQTLPATVATGGTWMVTPATLANGTHAVVASVMDAAGNAGSATQALTVDTAAPTVTISGGPTRSTNDTTPTITGTTDEPAGSTVTVTVAGQTLPATVQAGGTWTVTPSTLINGSHDVVASVTDSSENTGSATQALTVDTAAPDVTIAGGPTRSTNDTTPSITGTTDVDAGSTVTVTVAGQTMTPAVLPGGTWNVTPAALANGNHGVAASVTDAAGNTATATQVLTIDTAAPAVTISGGPTRSTNDDTPSITGTSDEPAGSLVTVTVDAQSLSTTVVGGAWTVTAAALVDGPYDVVASVTDSSSNTSSATQSLTVDTAAPDVTIAGGPTRSTNDTTPSITGTTDVDAGSTVTVTVAGQTMLATVQSGGTWSVTPATLTPGSHDVAAAVTDSAGNAGSATQALTIDTAAPTVTIAGGATRSTSDTTPTITGTTSEAAGTTVTVTVAGQTLPTTVQSGGTWSVTAATLTNASHDVAAEVTDTAGNPGSATQTLTIDTAAPTVTIAGGETMATNDTTPSITGTTSEAAGTTVTVTVAGQTLTTTVLGDGTWTVAAAVLVDGPYDVAASVTDLAGNVGSATQALTIDTLAPTLTIAGGATMSTNDTTPTIAGTASEAAGTTVTVTVAGQTLPTTVLSGGTWSVTAATLTNASHGVAASVTDVAGNTTTAAQALIIDTAAPTVTISGGPTRSTNDTTPTITGTSDEAAGTTVTVTVAGQTLTTTVAAGAWTVEAAVLVDGPHGVVASVTDPAGNPGSATQALTVDSVLPVVTISGGATASTSDTTPSIEGTSDEAVGTTVTVMVAGQTLTATVQSGGMWSVTPLVLATGTHVVGASATDAAGNMGTATQALTVDTTLPTLTITGGLTASTNDATPTITGTTDEAAGATVTVTVAGQTLSTVVLAGGTWNVTAAGLADGTHPVAASVTDPAGNMASATQSLTVDTVLPAVTISGGATRSTQDTTPTITGTADLPGATVTVTIGGLTLAALVQSGGTWNVTPTALVDGAYAVVASVADPAGNTASATQALTVDNVRPTVTITGGPTAWTNDATPAIDGTTDVAAGTTVTVTVAGHTMTTTAQSDGTWTVSPAALADGTHDVQASVTDPAGNTGTATQALTVDTTVPPMPDPPVSAFTPAGPKRVFDTRPGQSPNALRNVVKQKVGGAQELEVKVTDLAGFVPATGAGAVSLTVTATNSDADGFITVYACGTRESVSSVNYTAGETVANAVIAPVSANGTVCFFSSAPTDIVADVNGWFAAGQVFSAVGPKRVFDTRPGSPPALRSVPEAKIQAGNLIEVQLTDLAGFVPATGVGSVSLNVTVTNPAAAGFITVYSCGPLEFVSSVNYIAGQTVANAVIAPVSDTGRVCFYTSATADLVVDINGWLKADAGFTAVSPRRVLDTRPGQSPNALREVLEQKVGGEYVLHVRVTDLPGVVPATGVSAVSLNVTATNPDGDGFVTVYPCGTREEVSSLNYRAGQTVANAVLTPVSATGTICLFSLSPADVVVDVNGWFSDLPPQSG